MEPGNGGLIVIPGSHKGAFEKPADLLTANTVGDDPVPDPVFTNLTPKAGDFVVISELLTHGVLTWRRKDKDRRFLILRYLPQYEGKMSLPDEIYIPATGSRDTGASLQCPLWASEGNQ